VNKPVCAVRLRFEPDEVIHEIFMPSKSPTNYPPAGFFRRVAAVAYDLLLLAGLLMLAASPVVLIAGGTPSGTAGRIAYQTYLLAVVAGFFCWFWTHGGQTLGMRAWRLRLVSTESDRVTWLQALKRFVAAGVSLMVLGVGFLWIFHDRERCAWHDRLSGTRVVRT
jgi:uncharacterized RDD family membrane protein YckC